MSQRTYTAKILWQFRVQKGDESKKRRVCEERIVTFRRKNAEQAYKKIKKYARDQESSYCEDSANGVFVYTELVGIMDFFELTDWDDEEEFKEVWYDLYDKFIPLERKEKLVPEKVELREFYTGKLPRKGIVKLKW